MLALTSQTRPVIRSLAVASAIAVALAAGSASAANYSFTNFSQTAQWGAINNSDQVVSGGAYYSDVTSYEYSGGTFTGITSTASGNIAFYAYGINNAGVVAGTVSTTGYGATNYGALYNNGIFSAPITTLSNANTSVAAINDSGQLAGTLSTSTVPNEGFVLTGNTLTLINAPNADPNGTTVTGINNGGDIVGNTSASAFLYQNGTYKTIFSPTGGVAHVTSINNSGDVAGWYNLTSGGTLGFVYDEKTGAYTTVDAGSSITKVYGINDQGDLVGSGADGNLFIATASPVPLPATAWLLASGIGVLGAFKRKKHAAFS